MGDFLMTDPLSSAKADLRRRMEKLRAEACAQNPKAAFDLRDHFLKNIPLAPGGIVAGYRARGYEIDPAPLLQALHAAGHRLALPVMAGRDKPLMFRAYTPGDPLITNNVGIEEPGDAAAFTVPGILLVPLLAFDPHGNRLGTGGGYYDRTIKTLRAQKPVIAAGIGFFCQQVPLIPTGAHDAELDIIVTEIQVFNNLATVRA
jgi:5-formyltetrahydrofolate cyclo-ligase